MAQSSEKGTGVGETTSPRKSARSAALASNGVKTSRDFAAMMSALMSDILEERIDPRAANAVCNAGGKLLKMVEMEHKYGAPQRAAGKRMLRLSR